MGDAGQLVADDRAVAKLPTARCRPATDLSGETNHISCDDAAVSRLQTRSYRNRQHGLILVSANVHPRANQPRIGVQVSREVGGIGIPAGIDAKRIGSKVQVAAGIIYKQRIVRKIARAGRQRRGAAVVEVAAAAVIVRTAIEVNIVIDDAIVYLGYTGAITPTHAATGAAGLSKFIAGDRAIIQSGIDRPAAAVSGGIVFNDTTVQRATRRAATVPACGAATDGAVEQCGVVGPSTPAAEAGGVAGERAVEDH